MFIEKDIAIVYILLYLAKISKLFVNPFHWSLSLPPKALENVFKGYRKTSGMKWVEYVIELTLS